MKQFWNERYSSVSYIYGEQPNSFFVGELAKLSSGKLFLPGEGEGRNAVWAASKGWEVHAVDYSTEAKVKAMALANKNHVKIHAYTIADIDNLVLPEKFFDAAALVFLHLEPKLRDEFHKKIILSLKPGGHLIMEAFSKKQMMFQSGGPKNIEMLYSKEMLKTDFNTLEFLYLEEIQEVLNEGQHHSGEAALVRLVATKPLNS